MKITATKLRENIYAVLDQVLASGEPVEIQRNGRTLRITAVDAAVGLERVVPRPDYIVGDADDLAELEWSNSWSELTSSASIPMPSSGSLAERRKKSGRTGRR